MKVAVIQTDNNIRGLDKRLNLIDREIGKLKNVDFVVLPELSTPGYIPTQEIWKYAEKINGLTYKFAVQMCRKYNIYIGAGFVEKNGDEYFNSYIIAGKEKVYGICRKNESEPNIFRRGDYSHIITTPIGKIAVGISLDAHREYFYKKIKNEDVDLILFPHCHPTSINDQDAERRKILYLCETYSKVFNVPVVYANSIGNFKQMAGITGKIINPIKHKLCGNSCIYYNNKYQMITSESSFEYEIDLKHQQNRYIDIKFCNGWFGKGNRLYRMFIYKMDVKKGIKEYNKRKKGE